MGTPCIWKYFGTKIRVLAFGDLEILSDLGRDIKIFFSVFRNQGVIKRVEIKKNFDFGNYCSERENKSMLNIAKNCNIKYGLFESVLCETCLYA